MDILSNQIVKSSCRICYNSCGVLIHMENGQPVRVEGDPFHPISKGRLCPKGLTSLEYYNHPDRLLHPLKRVGEKGKGDWEQISWDEALEITAEGLSEAKERYGVLIFSSFDHTKRIDEINDIYCRLKSADVAPLTLGGEHTITYPN